MSEASTPAITGYSPRRGKLSLAINAAGMAAVVFVALFFPDREDGSGAVLGSIASFAVAAFGLAALRQTRVFPRRSLPIHLRYAALAVLLGMAVGTANLLINYGLTHLDPRVRAGILRKVTVSSDWSMVVIAPVVEELVFRLFVLSGLVWLLGRFLKNRERVFPIALLVSAILFGFIHPPFPVPITEPVLMVHYVAVLLKSSAAGLLYGWIFWRWGLPYSMVCHGATNGIHILLSPLFF